MALSTVIVVIDDDDMNFIPQEENIEKRLLNIHLISQ